MTEKKAIVYITKTEPPVLAQQKKAESYIGKCLLYHGLFEIFGYSWQDQLLALEEGGKPYFPKHQDVHFNISHSQEYIVCAIASQPVGIDIQYHKKTDIMRMAKRILSPEEHQRFLEAEDKQKAFFKYWVEKESFLKWTGEGLRRDMRTLDLHGSPQHIDVAEGYSCALWSAKTMEIDRREISCQSLVGE